MRADPADPLAPHSMVVTVQEVDQRRPPSQTPGRLTVTVDGHPMATFEANQDIPITA